MSCDVTGCTGQNYMGWRPLPERMGRKICEPHWRRHKDQQDSFDLFEAFGFERPVLPKKAQRKKVARCGCGAERKPSHRFCAACAAKRERQRKKQAYHDRKKRTVEPVVEKTTLRCKQCGSARLPGHSYCRICADRRKKQSNRERRRRSYRKTQNM
jgi:hypothetical protein